MNFKTFGDPKNKIMVLIHGVMTPWQIWQKQADEFMRHYFVIIPVLDAHDEECPSEFVSLEDEARKIEDYILENYGDRVYALCGLSMGGAIANVIFGNGRLKVDRLVFDGAPLIPLNKLMIKMMTASYLSILHGSQKRDERTLENFKKNFLPEEYLESFLKFTDTMSDESMKNIVNSALSGKMTEKGDKDTRILFFHGTKGNEAAAKRSAALVKGFYPNTEVCCLKGYAHCELCVYKTDDWIERVEKFLK